MKLLCPCLVQSSVIPIDLVVLAQVAVKAAHITVRTGGNGQLRCLRSNRFFRDRLRRGICRLQSLVLNRLCFHCRRRDIPGGAGISALRHASKDQLSRNGQNRCRQQRNQSGGHALFGLG